MYKRQVHTVAKSADVLDDKTVQKIDELANYIDEYYYEAVSYTHLDVYKRQSLNLFLPLELLLSYFRRSCIVAFLP